MSGSELAHKNKNVSIRVRVLRSSLSSLLMDLVQIFRIIPLTWEALGTKFDLGSKFQHIFLSAWGIE